MTLWKTPNIKPDMFRSHHIIVDYEAKGHTEPMLSTEYAELTADRYVNRWCYLDELLAQADKAEQLQKAVDSALDTLKKAETTRELTVKGHYVHAISLDELHSALEEIKQLIK